MTKQIHCMCVCVCVWGQWISVWILIPKGDISLVGGQPCLRRRRCSSQEAQTGCRLTSDPWLSACSGVMHATLMQTADRRDNERTCTHIQSQYTTPPPMLRWTLTVWCVWWHQQRPPQLAVTERQCDLSTDTEISEQGFVWELDGNFWIHYGLLISLILNLLLSPQMSPPGMPWWRWSTAVEPPPLDLTLRKRHI